MKKIVLFMAVCILAAIGCDAADNAAKLLDSATAKIRDAKSVTAVCRIVSSGGGYTASITMSGNKFTVKSPDLEVWYDGKNQWAYSPRTGEVNLTEPTKQELSQINPLGVLDYFSSEYTVSMLPAAKSTKNIRLTAKSRKSDIKTVDISIDATSQSPTSVTVIMASGESVRVNITSLKFGNTLPSSAFIYRKSLHPDAEIIDLR